MKKGLARLLGYAVNRRLFRLKASKWVGRGMPDTRVNDLLIDFVGGEVEFLVRAEDDENFKIVGDCFSQWTIGNLLEKPNFKHSRTPKVIQII
jgi:hypothetical protein